MLSAHH